MSNYQVEIDEFINAFSKFKNNRIALYGIGRRMYGVDVISLERAEKEADIIINAPETYLEKQLISLKEKELNICLL